MNRPTAVVGARLLAPTVTALARERLDRVLAGVWQHRLTLVIGPAGAGKTTLIAQFADRAGVPVAWYRAAEADASEIAVLSHLERAVTSALEGLPGGWHRVEDAACALDRGRGRRALLVIDDLHLLDGTEAEAALGRLLDSLPSSVVMLAASRQPPAFNLSRLRVSGALLEIGPDDLRFRSWEVERLFRDFYREPLPPEDLAELARRTEGWAAGLQLFHLATRGKPPVERRRTLTAIGTRSRLVREYLAGNVLAELPAELRRFLVDTCVLGRLTGPLCDTLRAATGSHRLLAELERRQIFTTSVDDEGTWRYHEVLRSHLESVLLEEVGEAEARRRHRRAGTLLEDAGSAVEALHAYCRAEDWPSVGRLLGRQGPNLAGDPGAWIDALPRTIRDDDPWLRLAMARRHLAAGHWAAAADAYQQARTRFGTAAPAETCRRERQVLNAWLDPTAMPSPDWTGLVRAASRREPLAALRTAAGLPAPMGRLAAGLSALLAGHVRGAEALLRAVAQHPQAGPPLVAGASLAAGIAQVLGRADGRGDLELSVERCDVLGLGWLASLGRAALCLAEDGSYEDALAVQDARRQAGDQWGAALAGLFAGLGALRAGDPSVQVLSSVADSFRRLDARVLEAWTRAALSIAAARAGAPDARSLAAEAEALTRATGAYGVLALAYTGMAEADPKRSGECSALAAMTHRECGLALPDRVVSLAEDGIAAPVQDGIAAGGPADALEQLAGELSSFDAVFAPFHATLARSRHRSRRGAHALTAGTPASEASLSLRCFGSFALSIGGRPVDATGVKPRARSALHLLAMHAGRPVHREALIEALWPEGDARAATRNLHVAVSTLRGLLEPGNARGEPSIVAREGDAYRLALPADAEVDVLYFERLLAQGRTAQATGDRRRAVAAYQRALDVYRGDLLPEEGPAEWVLSTRERYRAEAVEAARAAAELLLALAEPTRAAHAAHRGLAIDRYRSGLWRLLIRAHELDGDLAAAARTRQVYAEVLAELEIDDPVAFGASPRSQAFVKNSTSLIAQAPSGAGP